MPEGLGRARAGLERRLFFLFRELGANGEEWREAWLRGCWGLWRFNEGGGKVEGRLFGGVEILRGRVKKGELMFPPPPPILREKIFFSI